MNLILIGYRGTGKSTVARLVAQRLGWTSVDADDEIETLAGKSIAQIFADDGELAFRDLESRVVADLAHRLRCVVALGGGAVTRDENRDAIRRAGMVVWLRAAPEEIWQRVQADQATALRRPNLTTGGGMTEIIATLGERSPIYRQCAHFEVDTTGRTPAQVAEAIVARMNP